MGYGHMRRGRPGMRGSFVQVESRMTTTGASADEWVPVKPGTRRRARAGHRARDPRAQAEAGDERARQRANRRLVGRPSRLLTRQGRADHRCQSRRASSGSRTISRSRVPRVAIVGGVAARAHQRAVHGAGRQCAQRAARRCRPARRPALHAADPDGRPVDRAETDARQVCGRRLAPAASRSAS